jgi:hypothetical protein
MIFGTQNDRFKCEDLMEVFSRDSMIATSRRAAPSKKKSTDQKKYLVTEVNEAPDYLESTQLRTQISNFETLLHQATSKMKHADSI